jgi:ABC-type phosphate/phosphonate transport system permease subunit
MKNLLCFLFFVVATVTVYAQQPEPLTKGFYQMKDKAQTFKDYKVIKETVLVSFWKSVEDTLNLTKRGIKEAKEEIASLKKQVTQVQLEAKQKEAEVAEIVFDSTHITVMGISFHKAAFITLMGIVLGSFIGLLALLFTRAQLLSRSLKEKSEVLLIQSSEFEEYKHRAVEKQMKLSRELQNERNKLTELKVNR